MSFPISVAEAPDRAQGQFGGSYTLTERLASGTYKRHSHVALKSLALVAFENPLSLREAMERRGVISTAAEPA